MSAFSILNLSKKFNCIGFDINDKIQTLRNKRDLNKELQERFLIKFILLIILVN